MSTTTTRMGMLKPDGNENVNVVTQLNNNLDVIDQNIGFRTCTSSTRPTTVWAGLAIRESDTGACYVSDGSSPAADSWIQIPTGRSVTNWHNALAYGAAGDGVADDTTFIQDAIDAASGEGGGVVYLPQGTYKITANLVLKDYVRIRGDGKGITTITQTATSQHAFTGTNTLLAGIEEMQIDGPGSGTGMGVRILYETPTSSDADFPFYLTFRNVMVRQFGADGFYIEDVVMALFSEVTSKENGGAGIYLSTGGPGGTSSSFVTCFCHGNTGNGFRLDQQYYCTFTGCGADNNGGSGYKLESVGAVKFTGCGAEVNAADGIQVNAASEGVVIDTFWSNGPGGAAIKVTGNSTGTIIKGARQSANLGTATAFIDVDTGSSPTTIENCNGNGLPDDLAEGTCTFPGGTKFVRKTADESVTSSTAFQDDNHLTLTVEAGGVYTFKVFLLLEGSATGDFKATFTFPTGSTMHFTGHGPSVGLASGSAGDGEFVGRQNAASGSTTIAFGTAGTRLGTMLEGVLLTGSTAGSLTLQWTQNASDGTATTLKSGSFMKIQREA